MAKLSEGLVDKNMPFVNDSITIDENQIEDYVLVFANPFDVEGYTVSAFSEKIPSRKLVKRYLRMMRVASEDPILQPFLTEVQNLAQSADEVLAKDLAQITIKTVYKYLQEYIGFLLKSYLSADKDQIFVLLKASEHNLKVQADLIDYKLQFNEESSEVDKFNLKPFQTVFPYGPFEKSKGGRNQGLFAKKEVDTESYYQRYDSEGNPAGSGELFRFNDRVRLVYSMLSSTFELGEMRSFGLLAGDFPLHSKPALNELKGIWANMKSIFKPQPLEKIRHYYGEKLTMYFTWLEHYIYWLTIPAIFGTIIAIILFASGGVDKSNPFSSTCLLLFSLLLGVSSTFFDQLWVRKENTKAWVWGLADFEETEEQRPEHKGKYKKDEVSGKMKKIHPVVGLEKYASLMGYGVIFFFIGLIIAAIAAIFTYRSQGTDSLHTVLPGVINAVQIKIFNFVSFT